MKKYSITLLNLSAGIIALSAMLSVFSASALEQQYVKYQRNLIAITNVSLIDGLGSPAKNNQTLIIKNGKILAIGDSGSTEVPDHAETIDGKGITLTPGFVMMHEHMFYPTGKANYTEMLYSFPRLYLAGGATTIRTAGTTAPYADLNLNKAILEEKIAGPDIDVTAPYLNGPGLPILKINALGGVDDAARLVDYWQKEGVTSYKAYMHIHQDELAKVIQMAHAKSHKVTAHLCSVTYREAANLGIDNLEHGFVVMTDFVKNKQKDKCPNRNDVTQSLLELDLESKEFNSLVKLLVDKKVAITSTLTIFETYAPGRPKASKEALQALIPQVREQYESRWEQVQQSKNNPWATIFKKALKMEKMFVEAGGTLLVGTDPTGYGGVVAGFSNKRAIELLVETGLTFEEAIKVATLNGAKFLGRDHQIGSIQVGMRADLVLIDGLPHQNTSAIRNIHAVFKNGIGYDSKKIIQTMKNTVGLH